MSKVKVMLLTLLAVFAIGAVASASASALIWVECSKNPGGTGTKYPTKANCENRTLPGSGEWEWLPLLATAANPLRVHTLGLGNQVLSVSSGAFVIVCPHLLDIADYWNQGGVGRDLTLLARYTGCAVTKPSGCGFISSPGEPNGTIELAKNLPSRLVTILGVTYDEQEQNENKEFVTIDIETAEKSGLNCGVAKLTNKVKGSVLAKVNNSTQELEFENKSGVKPLEMNALPAEYEGKDMQEFPNGKVLAE